MFNIIDNKPEYTKLNYAPHPPFGSVHTPVVLSFELAKGTSKPEQVRIQALGDLPTSPFCSTLHYGQSIFEGMKVYRQDHESVGVFRPDLHARRFSRSAEIMAMVPFSSELFLESLFTYVRACKEYVPSEPGHSLYLRPLLIANDPVIKLKSSASYRFVVMSSIAGSYFNEKSKGQRVVLNKSFSRAFPGGAGEAKTAANYALSLNALEYAYSKNYDQVLYLDALKRQKIEEFGGMNFFMVKDGELFTPKLDGQILRGVTRQSVIEIAREMGIPCHEKDILLTDVIGGGVDEVFACGTAAAIAPIAEIGVEEAVGAPTTAYHFESTAVGDRIRQYLVDTQFGRTKMSESWLHLL